MGNPARKRTRRGRLKFGVHGCSCPVKYELHRHQAARMIVGVWCPSNSASDVHIPFMQYFLIKLSVLVLGHLMLLRCFAAFIRIRQHAYAASGQPLFDCVEK
jgi:hypothetical protein